MAIVDQSRYGAAKHTTFGNAESCAVSAADIPEVVQEMRQVFAADRTLSRSWRMTQLEGMLRLCREGRGELQDAMKKDLGKSGFEAIVTEIGQVEAECVEAIAHLDEWMTPKSTKTSALNWPAGSYTVHDPLGVVLVMGAWNYPVNLTLCPVVGALAGGNCVLVRPGSYAVETSHTLCRLLHKYMDRDCVRVAEGDRTLTAVILEQKFDKIFYTGSGFVGKIVAEAAAKHLTPVALELGGKSPAIVDKSAHLVHAAQRLVWATFLNSGQTCVRPDFCLVHKDVADEFLRVLKDTVQDFYSKDPKSTEWFGRIINKKAFDHLVELMTKSKDNLAFGGDSDAAQRYIQPSVFDFGSDLKAFNNQPLMSEELFGPLLPVCRFEKIEEAIDFARNLRTGKPLALYIYARDNKVIDAVTRRTTSGGLCINDSIMHLSNHELPFGGVGESGMGAYHGHYSFKAFTHEKAVLQKYPGLDQLPLLSPLLAARFPPYTSLKKFIIFLFSQRLVAEAVNVPLGDIKRFLMKLLALVFAFRMAGYRVSISK